MHMHGLHRLQEQRGEMELTKVKANENLADSMTKYVESEKIRKPLWMTTQKIVEGRHELAPHAATSE